ncbi:hypothetical protein FB45DRAFT_5733 [Roridomyces roridus]|uniref:F-box domain-containing protein n=1 Tax=Roridomyces roridus TaxID=1738132 RepID=A0AAD7CIW0_9AGAR|nr:hypothetical protein FB45DRAFT_5733 [Roridomyces roridus]
MSAQLEAQIEQISLEIERQKVVLRKLESDKSLLQQQLNAERDPIARLPLEISSDIFLQCLPLPSDHGCLQPKAHLAPLLLLNICNIWTNIACSTPALWASIGISFPHPTGFECLLEGWLRRAGSYPLQISLRGVCTPRVASATLHHSAQLQSLRISFGKTNTDELDNLEEEFCHELLGGFLPQSQMELPCLQMLEIWGQPGTASVLLESVHRLLRLSPNLSELNIQHITFMKYMDEEDPQTLVLPHLLHLTYFDNFDALKISAPRLETLCTSTGALVEENFISFLRQSSPPLWKLKLDGRSVVDSLPDDSMSLLPNLTHLESSSSDSLFVKELLDFLTRNTHIVPRLEAVQLDEVILEGPGSPGTYVLTALAGVLSARRSRLKTVRLTNDCWNQPLPDDLTFFRDLLEAGMDIRIAPLPGGLDFLSSS